MNWHLREARLRLKAGGIIAYPTEAVYGLGCDPMNAGAVHRLLGLKRRAAEKGLILIAADFGQLAPFLLPLPPLARQRVLATWPGPVTWVCPARPETPKWLRGRYRSLAVRVTAHPLAAELCRSFGGPIVSTSANVSSRPPARSALAVHRIFGQGVDLVLHGPLGGLDRPTSIRDAGSGKLLRPG